MRKFTAALIFAALMTVAASSQEAKPSAPPTAPKMTTEQKLAIKSAKLDLANAQLKLMQTQEYLSLVAAQQTVQSTMMQIFTADKADVSKYTLDGNQDFVEIAGPVAPAKK